MYKDYISSNKKLTKENKKIIRKMQYFMQTRNINEVTFEDVLQDIIGMALEYQERGESFSDAFHGSYESFCREMLKSCPKQSFIERVLSAVRWFLMLGMLLIPVMYFIEMLFPTYSPAENIGLDYCTGLSFPLKYGLLLIVLVIGWYFVRMLTYKPTFFVLSIYVTVLLCCFFFADTLLSFIIKASFIRINILVWTVVWGILIIMCFLLRRLVAFTLAYRRNRKRN